MFAGKKSILLSCIVLLIWSSTMGDVSASRKIRSEFEKTGEMVWDIQTKEKVIALTFDDGPHPVYTKEILDLLAQNDAKATFFIVGSEEGYRTILWSWHQDSKDWRYTLVTVSELMQRSEHMKIPLEF